MLLKRSLAMLYDQSFTGVVYIILTTLIAYVFLTLNIFLLVYSFHSEINFIDTVFIITVVFVFSYLPISVGSLGVREGIIIVALTMFSIPKLDATTVALFARAIMYGYAMIGGVLFLFATRTKSLVQADSLP